MLMRLQFRVLLCVWLVASLVFPATAVSKPQPPFPFNGVVLWSTSIGAARPGQPGTTRLHTSTVHNGRTVTETQTYQFPVPSRGAEVGVFLLSPDARTVLSLQTYDSPYGPTDLSLIDLVSRRVRRITRGGSYSRNGSLLWSPDGGHFLATTGEGRMHVFDAIGGERVAAADLACVPVWTRDGRSIVFSRFLVDGQPATPSQLRGTAQTQRVSQQFWAVSITGEGPVQISEQDVDRRMGPAYRRAMRVSAQATTSGQVGLCGRDQQGALQIAPDGRRAVVVTDATKPQSGGTPPWDMIAPPLLEASPWHPQTRVSFVGAAGITKQYIVPGRYDLAHRSADGQYVYGVGTDGEGRRALVAINIRTFGLSVLSLGDEWQERDIEDVCEMPPPHESRK